MRRTCFSHKQSLLLALTLFLALFPEHSQAQDQKQSFENSIPENILDNGRRFLTLTTENDLYATSSDQNYTNGIRATYFDVGAKTPEFAFLLAKYIPAFNVNKTTSVYYSLGQNLYTPEDIAARTPNPKDRPYSAFLYGTAGLTSITDNHIDDLEVTLGVVGPWALGEETQEAVHDIVNATDPSGWDHQLENEAGLILSWQRRWPEAYAQAFGPLYFRFSPYAGASLGNIYTYGAGGITAQLTPKRFKWQSDPLRVRPAMPGNGFFSVPDNQFSWSLFAGVEERVVARNIFLDGNSFESGPSVNKKTFVTDANTGITLTYGRTQIAYTINWRSKEFDGQGDPSIFGALSIAYRF
jgi:hypothetical protein